MKITLLLVLLVLLVCLFTGAQGACHRRGMIPDRIIRGRSHRVGKLRNQTLQSCEAKCTANPRCDFFYYIRPDFQRSRVRTNCYLKRSIRRTRRMRGVTMGYSKKGC